MLALVVPTAAADLVPALTAARLASPLPRSCSTSPTRSGCCPRPRRRPGVPAYAYPESAARALGRAARYGAWRSRPAGTVPELAGPAGGGGAGTDRRRFLSRLPGGGWLPAAEAAGPAALLPLPLVARSRLVTDADRRGGRGRGLGGHVVLKADVPGLVHKSDAGAVAARPARPRRGARPRSARWPAGSPGRLSGVVVQPMITGGTEVIIGVVQEPVFGPLVVFGLGGVATEVLGDHAARLAPLTSDRRRRPDPLGPRRPAAARPPRPAAAGHRGAARHAAAGVPARRRPARGRRARPQPGDRLRRTASTAVDARIRVSPPCGGRPVPPPAAPGQPGP